MHAQRSLTAREFRVALVLLAFFLLAGGLASLTFAIERMPAPRNRVQGETGKVEIDPSTRWPATTPHDIEWPTPHSWDRTRAFGIWRHNVFGEDETGGRFQMEVREAGWPLPAVQQKWMWWDWDDPALDGPDSDPAIAVLYSALCINTLALGGGAWLLIVVLPLILIALRRGWLRRRRHRRGLCLACGYELGDIETCPECGVRTIVPTPTQESPLPRQ